MSDSAKLSRFRGTIEYDGTSFHGSQLQPDVRTVQGEIERVLCKLFDGPARVELAGRTDTGVHAAGQEIAFGAPARWDAEELTRALTALLPDDIAVRGLVPTPGGFHPRFDAEARRYEYVVVGGERVRPLLRGRCWAVDRRLDLALLDTLAASIEGERSFDSFAKAGQPERGTRCCVERARWIADRPPFVLFEVVADRFLHHMVRYLIGTSIEIATGDRPREDLGLLLEGRTASRPVFPAPAAGLYLTGVRYGEVWNRPSGIPWIPEA